jgi:DNA-directed RNA polymerase specialized sigma24 family protein
MPRAKSEHYVDNKKLYAEMVTYLEAVKESEESDSKRPRVPEYIGECLLKISTRLSTKPNFINYTYRDEMISDGIENCINYIGNFNPEKSTNPFAYFTQIIYYAFLRRIQREKKQLYIKHKSLERSVVFDELATTDGNPEQGDQGAYINLNTDYMNDFVANFERKEDEKKEARKKKKADELDGLEKFVKDDEDDK